MNNCGSCTKTGVLTNYSTDAACIDCLKKNEGAAKVEENPIEFSAFKDRICSCGAKYFGRMGKCHACFNQSYLSAMSV